MTVASMVRFPIRFDPGYRALSAALLLTPSDSFVAVGAEEVRIRMAWAFRARFPRTAVISATIYDKKPLSRGIHGWAGRWLVNGSGEGIVDLALEPRQRGFVMGIPVRLRNVLVSVDDATGLMALLTPTGPR